MDQAHREDRGPEAPEERSSHSIVPERVNSMDWLGSSCRIARSLFRQPSNPQLEEECQSIWYQQLVLKGRSFFAVTAIAELSVLVGTVLTRRDLGAADGEIWALLGKILCITSWCLLAFATPNTPASLSYSGRLLALSCGVHGVVSAVHLHLTVTDTALRLYTILLNIVICTIALPSRMAKITIVSFSTCGGVIARFGQQLFWGLRSASTAEAGSDHLLALTQTELALLASWIPANMISLLVDNWWKGAITEEWQAEQTHPDDRVDSTDSGESSDTWLMSATSSTSFTRTSTCSSQAGDVSPWLNSLALNYTRTQSCPHPNVPQPPEGPVSRGGCRASDLPRPRRLSSPQEAQQADLNSMYDEYYTVDEWNLLAKVVAVEKGQVRINNQQKLQELQQMTARLELQVDDKDPGSLLPEYIHDVLTYYRVGRGSYGEVMAVRKRSADRMLAIKIPLARSKFRQLFAGAKMLAHLSHPNIVRYEGFGSVEGKVGLLMQFCEERSLAHLLVQTKGLDDTTASILTGDIVEAVAYLHRHSIWLRDLKPANCLLRKHRIVLSGFSSAVYVRRKIQVNAQGSLLYMSPETVQGKDAGRKSDVWSIGCCCLEMLTKMTPAELEPNYLRSETAAHILSSMVSVPTLPATLGEQAKVFLLKCFTIDPDVRPTAFQLQRDEWIASSRHSSLAVSSRKFPEEVEQALRFNLRNTNQDKEQETVVQRWLRMLDPVKGTQYNDPCIEAKFQEHYKRTRLGRLRMGSPVAILLCLIMVRQLHLFQPAPVEVLVALARGGLMALFLAMFLFPKDTILPKLQTCRRISTVVGLCQALLVFLSPLHGASDFCAICLSVILVIRGFVSYGLSVPVIESLADAAVILAGALANILLTMSGELSVDLEWLTSTIMLFASFTFVTHYFVWAFLKHERAQFKRFVLDDNSRTGPFWGYEGYDATRRKSSLPHGPRLQSY